LVKAIQALGGEVRCKESVKSILTKDQTVIGWRTQRKQETLDAVLATPAPPALWSLLPKGLKGDYWERLHGVEYLGNVCAVLTLKRSLSPIYWMNIPDVKSPFIAVIEHTNFVSPEHYGGKRVMYLSSYLPVEHPRYKKSDKDLLSEYYAYLKKVIPDFQPSDVVEAKVFHAPYAQPVVRAGYGDRLVSTTSPIEGLFLANMAQIYPEDRGMSYSIRLGQEAAQVMAASPVAARCQAKPEKIAKWVTRKKRVK
jgi:protoporphyrinogen oxidase